jgi:hypothetical protein
MKTKTPDMTGISRIDQEERPGRAGSGFTRCWTVRLGWTRDADSGHRYPAINATFSDGVYGGREAALRAAIRFRDRARAALKRQTVRRGGHEFAGFGTGSQTATN